MGLTGRSSSGLAAVCCTMLFAGLQMFKTQLGSSRLLTLIAGYVSSWIFVFLLISVNSLEQVMFGPGFQSKLPEVVLCIIVACGSAATVHRVSSTVCFLCSIIALYFISRISEERQSQTSPAGLYAKKKK